MRRCLWVEAPGLAVAPLAALASAPVEGSGRGEGEGPEGLVPVV